VNLNFSQTITVHCSDPAPLLELCEGWDRQQATTDIMGYMGVRLLADRETPGRYVLLAEFGIVDPDVSAVEEAQRNNERPETQMWLERLRAVVDGEPEFHDYDEIYRTG
jgi:hypothetical protein